MSLREQVLADMTVAMKSRETLRLETLRMLKAALQRQEIEVQKQLDDAEIIGLIGKLVKQRRESADAFMRGGRQELADKEQAEIVILEAYLPKAVSSEELSQTIDHIIATSGASSPKDIGLVMKQVMAHLAGKNVDGKAVNQLVRSKLGG